jgi:hypothetical protein
MLIYRGAESIRGVCVLCKYCVAVFLSVVCSTFFLDVVREGGKVFVYIVPSSLQGTTSSGCEINVVHLLRLCHNYHAMCAHN